MSTEHKPTFLKYRSFYLEYRDTLETMARTEQDIQKLRRKCVLVISALEIWSKKKEYRWTYGAHKRRKEYGANYRQYEQKLAGFEADLKALCSRLEKITVSNRCVPGKSYRFCSAPVGKPRMRVSGL